MDPPVLEEIANVIPDFEILRPAGEEPVSEGHSKLKWTLLEKFVFGFLVTFLVVTSPISVWFCLKTIQHSERAIHCRFGKIIGVLEPGLAVYNPLTDVLITYAPKILFIESDKVFLSDGEAISFIGKTFVEYEVTDPSLAWAKLPESELYVEGMALALTENILRSMELVTIVQSRKILEQTLAASMQKLIEPLGYGIKNVFLHVVVTISQAEPEVEVPNNMYQ